MITQNDIAEVLKGYDLKNLTIGVLGGHSGLDVCHGAKLHGFKTVAVCQKGREKTYSKYYKTRLDASTGTKGCVDEVILVDKFADIVKPEIQDQLRKMNTIFIHNRYFWVYCDFNQIESDFRVPIFGTREMLKLEERDVEQNQYYLLQQAGIRIPKMFATPDEIDRLVLVKVSEELRGYERAFFLASSPEDYRKKSDELLASKIISEQNLARAVIEEFIVGAPVNLNYFYSPLDDEVELMGTDMRRQTNLDGLLRLPATEQMAVLKYMKPRLIETGHVAVTMKESLVEKAFELGEKFISLTKKEVPPGLIGPFALQGAVAAEDGREEFVIFDVSMRIPGSPGTRFTPYSGYLYGNSLSYGDRIAMEIHEGVQTDKLASLLT
ncbi:MAG: formate--phosphoribosylaminoimidazolecarboxamide ligase family protein [Candidatus Gracilibacteria bacterium]